MIQISVKNKEDFDRKMSYLNAQGFGWLGLDTSYDNMMHALVLNEFGQITWSSETLPFPMYISVKDFVTTARELMANRKDEANLIVDLCKGFSRKYAASMFIAFPESKGVRSIIGNHDAFFVLAVLASAHEKLSQFEDHKELYQSLKNILDEHIKKDFK